MTWKVEYFKEAQDDLKKMDKSVKIRALKVIEKVSENPLPRVEGGYGKPLENYQYTKLSGYFKIRSGKFRIVYGLVRKEETMKIVVVAVRDDGTVYDIANKRINRE
ncbi:type II toxin-antitoxin system RelE family toxin [Methanolapillus ohkumae]|uniref:Type II toxin-antitoxin system RelE/ParE family toxin n=1 Tax=Methanolapillus ohkumae TaxID=3028298 RepID=A0AA96ZWD6_9EURY|nr:hypothetical protein MsAm2_02280 [Methanosarcinaceae archaeon Am2]